MLTGKSCLINSAVSVLSSSVSLSMPSPYKTAIASSCFHTCPNLRRNWRGRKVEELLSLTLCFYLWETMFPGYFCLHFLSEPHHAPNFYLQRKLEEWACCYLDALWRKKERVWEWCWMHHTAVTCHSL